MLTPLQIATQLGVQCLCNIDAAQLSTFKGGGVVKTLLLPHSAERLCAVMNALLAQGYSPFVLGAGSNVIVSDGVILTPVISTKKLCGTRVCNGKICAQAGASIKSIIDLGRENGLGGLEFLCGVPCSLGGALKMNAGAFGSQVADYADETSLLSFDCAKNEYHECVFEHRQVDFGYRKGVNGIVLGAKLRLLPMSREDSLRVAGAWLKQRSYKQPKEHSCGSVFKNGSYPAALLIDRCALKGRTSGGAQISEKHANFIVNRASATAQDFLSLVQLCEDAVYERFGVRLEREFVLLE